MTKRFLSLFFSILLFTSLAQAQTTQVTFSFNEQFFDALLDAVFSNLKQPEFPLGNGDSGSSCGNKIILRREMQGVRTAVRFREGQIYAPIAFTGSYEVPLIGCVDFDGYAETRIDLEFDRGQQKLVGRVKVLNVQLGRVPSAAGSLFTRVIQTAIDKRINPLEILGSDKLTFNIPVRDSGALKMRVVGIRHEVGSGNLKVYVDFQFLKAE